MLIQPARDSAIPSQPERDSALPIEADSSPPLREELERAQRVASGQLDAQNLEWLSKGFTAFLASGGALPLA